MALLPGSDGENQQDADQDKKSKLPSGWKFGLVFGAAISSVVLAINCAVTIWSASLPKGSDGGRNGRRILYEGSCDKSRVLSIILHVFINIFSSVLLGASNYGMQCLSAPTRANIDKVHAEHRWMDIGILSIRNLRNIPVGRHILWWLLALSSIPLHLLYNSVVFSSITSADYTVYNVDDRFGVTDDLTYYHMSNKTDALWQLANAGTLDNLTSLECINSYATAFQSSRSDVVLISEPDPSIDPDEKLYIMHHSMLRPSWPQGCPPDVYEWICSLRSCETVCRTLLPDIRREADDWKPFGHRVKYCLSKPVDPLCRLNFNIYLAIAIIGANAFKALILAYTAFHPPEEPLFVLGDAIQSFLASPDPFSRNSCLASMKDVKQGKRGDWMGPRVTSPETHTWGGAVSGRRWLASILLYCVALGVSVFFLAWGIISLTGSRDLKSLWNLGFGAISETALITGLGWALDHDLSLLENVLAANAPHLCFSVLYFMYNGLFTCMLAAKEWSDFGCQRKAIRVSSDPRGQQRARYFLQLPFRFSIPLLLLSIVMHWMLSQSIFVVAIEIREDLTPPSWHIVTCGYSPIAIIFVILTSFIMVVSVLITGCFQLSSSIPVVGSCSLAIAAACHHPDGFAQPEAPLVPLKWGVMRRPEDGIAGHCGFSTEDVVAPEVGM